MPRPRSPDQRPKIPVPRLDLGSCSEYEQLHQAAVADRPHEQFQAADRTDTVVTFSDISSLLFSNRSRCRSGGGASPAGGADWICPRPPPPQEGSPICPRIGRTPESTHLHLRARSSSPPFPPPSLTRDRSSTPDFSSGAEGRNAGGAAGSAANQTEYFSMSEDPAGGRGSEETFASPSPEDHSLMQPNNVDLGIRTLSMAPTRFFNLFGESPEEPAEQTAPPVHPEIHQIDSASAGPPLEQDVSTWAAWRPLGGVGDVVTAVCLPEETISDIEAARLAVAEAAALAPLGRLTPPPRAGRTSPVTQDGDKVDEESVARNWGDELPPINQRPSGIDGEGTTFNDLRLRLLNDILYATGAWQDELGISSTAFEQTTQNWLQSLPEQLGLQNADTGRLRAAFKEVGGNLGDLLK